eukprot:4919540-Ditylum_brightwellii.AAC.1
MPDGNSAKSSHTCTVDLPMLLKQACYGHAVPPLYKHALFSVAQLTDAGCIVIFLPMLVIILYQNKPVLVGYRDHATKLWKIPL